MNIPSSKKIIHITEPFGGGSGVYIYQLAQPQSRDGFDVVVAHACRADTPSETELQRLLPPPIRRIIVPMVRPISPLNDLSCLIKIIKLIQNENPDIIHLHSSKAGVLGRIAAWLTGKSKCTFYTPNGLGFLRRDISKLKQFLFLFFERIACFFGGSIIAVSQTEEQLVRKYIGAKNVYLIENALDVTRIPEYKPQPEQKIRIFTIGRICHQKNPKLFAEIVMSFQNLSNIEFVWIGDGDLRHELLLENEHLPNLTITGWLSREEIFKELAKGDIYVMTSLWEGMPFALIEAQVAGIPAVVTDVVGNRDVVENEVTGFVCADQAEMLSCLQKLIGDYNLRKKMGQAARDKGMERFSLEKQHRRTLEVYNL